MKCFKEASSMLFLSVIIWFSVPGPSNEILQFLLSLCISVFDQGARYETRILFLLYSEDMCASDCTVSEWLLSSAFSFAHKYFP